MAGSLCLASSAQTLAQSQKPADLNPHFGEVADPTIWPTSSVGKLTIVFPNNMIEYCTGALVAPKVVLTAAHCLYPGGRFVSGVKLAAPGSVHFSAGLNRGVPLAHSVAERLEVSKRFQPSVDRTRDWQVAGDDWALVFLKDALTLKPIPVQALTGEEIDRIAASKSARQIGYGPDRQFMPSIFRDCVIGKTSLSSVLFHKCFAFGYSGAPILVDIGGAPAIVAVGALDAPGKAVGDPSALACSASAFAGRLREILLQK